MINKSNKSKKDYINSNASNYSNGHEHKLTAECFTKCSNWKLNATLTQNKTSTGLIFQGKGLFFKKLQTPILTNFNVIDTISEINKNTIKNLEEKAFNHENKFSDKNYDFSLFNFPINNSENSFLNSQSNMLNNNLFLEFDFATSSSNISKEHLKTFTEINNEFVEKEINFVLNGTIHGKQMFKKDVRFSTDAKMLIKSMQFRLKNYKDEFIEKQNLIQKSNPNLEIKNSKFNFFTRIVGNDNIGIEFLKPNFENVEFYQTNFNSIANSNITIEKIYFEFCIPNAFINNKTINSPSKHYSNSNSIYNNTNSWNYNKSQKENNSKFNYENNQNNSNRNYYTDNNISQRSLYNYLDPNSNPDTINKLGVKNKKYVEHSIYNNKIEYKALTEKLESKLLYKDNRAYNEVNLKTNNNNNNNPYSYSNTNQNVPTYTQNNAYSNSYKSNSESSNYNNSGNYYQSNKNQIFYDDRSRDNYNNQDKRNYSNGSNSMINNLENRKYSNGSTGSNNNNYQNQNQYQIQTITYNQSTESSIYNNNLNTNSPFSKSTLTTNLTNINININTNTLINTKNSSNTKLQTLQILLANYEGMCNFIIFAKSCTPYVSKPYTHLIDDIKLLNFLKNFEKISAFGLDLNYIYESEICPVNYSPTLSSMEILFSDLQSYEKILNELNEIRVSEVSDKEASKFYDYTTNYETSSTSSNENIKFEYNPNENLKFVVYERKIKIEFYEVKPPHGRCILSNALEEIFKKLKCFESIDLTKIDKCSWFCVLWSPFRSVKSQFSSTSFLAYYQFSYTDSEMFYRGDNNYLEIPIIGVLPIRFDEKTWLSKICKMSNLNYTSSLLDFKMALNDSVNNVHDFVFSNTDRTPTDYEFYLKSRT